MVNLVLFVGSALIIAAIVAWATDQALRRYRMSVVLVAVCIVAAFIAALIRYAFTRDVREAAGFGVALLVGLLIFAAGPAVLKL